jgi:hypothetical protein
VCEDPAPCFMIVGKVSDSKQSSVPLRGRGFFEGFLRKDNELPRTVASEVRCPRKDSSRACCYQVRRIPGVPSSDFRRSKPVAPAYVLCQGVIGSVIYWLPFA